MKKLLIIAIIAILSTITAHAQFWQTDPSQGKYFQRIKVINSLIIPVGDTSANQSTIDSIGSIMMHDNDMYILKNVSGTRYWQKIATGSGLAIDSLYRSGDTLFTRDTHGDVDTVVMDYYTRSQLDTSFIRNSKEQQRGDYNISGDGVVGNSLRSGLRFSTLLFNTLDTTYFRGTSITQQYNATPFTNRFSTKLVAAIGGKEKNFGIGSSTMQSGMPLGAASAIDFITTLPFKGANTRFVVIEYGLNDVGCNAPGYDTVFFKRDYRRFLDTLVRRGWSMKDVLLLAPSFISDSGYRKYSTLNSGNGVPTKARHLQYVDAVRAIAQQYGTGYLNMYDSMRVNNWQTLLDTDSLHPNNAGHAFMANQIASYMRKNMSTDLSAALYVDSTKVTTSVPVIVNGNTNDGSGAKLQVVGKVRTDGISDAAGKFIVDNTVAAFPSEVAMLFAAYSYNSANYHGGHFIANAGSFNMESVGKGTLRALPLFFGTNNFTAEGTKRFLKIDTTGVLTIDSLRNAYLLMTGGTGVLQQKSLASLSSDLNANFIANNNASAQTADMWISGSASVGTVSTEKFNVSGNALLYANNALLKVRSDVSGVSGIGFYGAANAQTGYLDVNGGTGQFRVGGALASYYLSLFSGNAEAIRILVGGNVGVGTTSPSEKLDVNGNIKLSGSIKMATGAGSNKVLTSDGSGTGTWQNAIIPTLSQVVTAGNSTAGVVNVGALGVAGVSSFAGSMFLPVRTVTATATLTNADYAVIVNNSSAATINLPTAGGANAGMVLMIKKISGAALNVTIDPLSAETIDAAATKVLTLQYSSVLIQSDGTNWVILSSHAAATLL